MKNIKKIVAIVISLFTILSLFACGVKVPKIFGEIPEVTMETAAAYSMTNGFGRTAMKSMAVADTAYEMEEADSGIGSDRKLIKTVDITSETKEFEKSIEWLKSHIESFSGIIDNSYIDSGNISNPNYRKNAHFSVRVPADRLKSFVSTLGTRLNITFEQESVRDVTDTYDDTESRKTTLLLEETKLNELLSKAKTVDELVSIESKLSEVRFELQNIENRLKRLDRQIDYSTVNITIMEVKDLTEAIEKEDYSKENLLKLLHKNFEDTKRFAVKAGVYIFTHIPAICLFLIAFVAFLFVILFIRTLAGDKETKRGTSRKKSIEFVDNSYVKTRKAASEDIDESDEKEKKTVKKTRKKTTKKRVTKKASE